MQLGVDAKMCISKNTVQKPLRVFLLGRIERPGKSPVLHCLHVLLMRLCSQMLTPPHCYLSLAVHLVDSTSSEVVLGERSNGELVVDS
jgi:hypothetical protein